MHITILLYTHTCIYMYCHVCYSLGMWPSIPCSSIALLRQYHCKRHKTRSRHCVTRGCLCSSIAWVIQNCRNGTPKQTAEHHVRCVASVVARGCPCNRIAFVTHYSCTGTQKIQLRCCVLCGCICRSIALVMQYDCKGTPKQTAAVQHLSVVGPLLCPLWLPLQSYCIGVTRLLHGHPQHTATMLCTLWLPLQ